MGANDFFGNNTVKNAAVKNAPNATLAHLNEVKVVRWRGGQHPTFQAITQKMEQEGLRPYASSNGPNSRIAARSHGYAKVLYCVEGSLELFFPDVSQSLLLRPGDRVELPRGLRHATIVGSQGARCLECAKQ